jgi:hypothetical protein
VKKDPKQFQFGPEFPREHIKNGQRVVDLWQRSDCYLRSGTITNVHHIQYGNNEEVAFEVVWDNGGTNLFLVHPTRTIGLHP